MGRVTGNGRAIVGAVPYPRVQNDMEIQIHQIEQEAYSAILRAFKAQSDAITWVFALSLSAISSFSLASIIFLLFYFLFSLHSDVNFSLASTSFLQEKESLISELRKELRVSNDEHRELLNRVNADDIIRRIRFSFE